MAQVDYEQRMDMDRMREYRVSRIKKYMDEFDIECLLLFESGNKRYATSTAVASPEVDNMGRYAIVPRIGYPHIFGFGSEVAAEKLYCPWIKEYTFPANGTMYGALPMAWKCYELFLKDVVRVIRSVRPDVILTMNRDGMGGGQHHQGSARLAHEAFRVAADPARYPEQIKEGLRPWQARKIYQAGGGPGLH
jgi:hypothetical protein